MTHIELTYYRLYPQAMRVTTIDDITGRYEYLTRNQSYADNLMLHLNEAGFQHVDIELLANEMP